MSADVWYVDTSALVKTVIEEPESSALLRWLADKDRLVASELVRVETVRAVRVSDPRAAPRARQVAAAVTLIRLDDPLYDLAGVVTYDTRMTEAAAALQLHVETPGRSERTGTS